MKLTPPPVQSKAASTEAKEVPEEVESAAIDSRSSAGDIFVAREAIEAERESKEIAEDSEEEVSEETKLKEESIQDKADRMFEFMQFVANQSANNPIDEPEPAAGDYDYGVSDSDLYGETGEY